MRFQSHSARLPEVSHAHIMPCGCSAGKKGRPRSAMRAATRRSGSKAFPCSASVGNSFGSERQTGRARGFTLKG
jgi:hypothetical protein